MIRQIAYEMTSHGLKKSYETKTQYIPITKGRSFAEKKAKNLRRRYPNGIVTLEEGYFHGWMGGGFEECFILKVKVGK